ncbi:uncharacterized protein HMPREF1541_04139 [Cyphellophora europaea CBS 101466]|uniref:TAP42-like protein n=1 Tax=Cyphellophora europaea (strain CBS 101466) TaxID=1220924 RepID=W2S2B8_CYPE1|nr:uncharacterized protein HMPREF1541_04139 [Cyphellophora europaea CBS 101466]ETN42198.1 hypothetical protein HMPREF1541_04139 [Cyphellophora europaea CBS 101466]
MAEQVPDRSLRETYTEAKAKRDQLGDLDPRSSVFKDTLQATLQDLELCQRLISELAVFSPNEELDDLSTQSLQYLTVDYLIAELLQRTYDANRLAALRRVSGLLDDFLTRLDQYSMLSTEDHKLFERYQEGKTSFALLPPNPEERRRLKIKRFQEGKDLKKKLEYLSSQSQVNHVDDETVRSLYLAEIAFFVHESFQSLDSISQETAILAQMQQAQPTPMMDPRNDPRAPQRTDGYSERLDGPTTLAGLGRKGGPLLDSKGKPMQPFTLLDKRSQMRGGVFRPGHNLPTMSIDEYLEEERRRGGIIEGGGDVPQPEPDEDNMEEVDAATMKARDWDEFVEANTKGAGNTLNRG